MRQPSLRSGCTRAVPFERARECAGPVVDERGRAPGPVGGGRRYDLCRRDPRVQTENPIEVTGGESLELPLPYEASDIDAVGSRRGEVVADVPVADRIRGRWPV